ncbi:tyrosine-type recombinase/integrase [Azospirillum sp. sgz302134]
MRAGPVSAAAVRAQSAPPPVFAARHCAADEYDAFLDTLPIRPAFRRQRHNFQRRFARFWPNLEDWLSAPLAERVGRLNTQTRATVSHRVSHQARSYLYYLALTDHVRLDYEWLLAIGDLRLMDVARPLGIDLGIDELSGAVSRLGFHPDSARLAMHWAVGRIALHTGLRDPGAFRAEHVEDLLAAVRRFGERPDIGAFYGSAECYRVSPSKAWITHLHQLQLVLFHRGQVHEQPRKVMPLYAAQPSVRPEMQAVVDRWLAVRRVTDRPATVYRLGLGLRRFLEWLAVAEPEIGSFAAVTRTHVLDFFAAMASQPQSYNGRPLAPLAAATRRARTSALSLFFRETAALGWDGVPGRPLIEGRDQPRPPLRIPRFIPADELATLMTAIQDLACPFQRAALLTARWSGARRGEIRRLAVDALDRYPDGTARLRIPAGKTHRERMVPLHDEAAEALRLVVAQRTGGVERAFTDDLTGLPVRYLFMAHGKLLSIFYLFDTALQKACTAAGLTDAAGRGTVSAHRFRHTVGTQLAERGAKLHTIMSVLGHRSPGMSMVYARISDPEVLRDYQAVLGPGAVIAGPGAAALHTGALPAAAIDWLKTNFFKTELELGHCLRLPAEGPCECDLCLSCARFVTTSAYAPRLRERHRVELELAEDARQRGWSKEIERHCAVAARIERLLADLGAPLQGE